MVIVARDRLWLWRPLVQRFSASWTPSTHFVLHSSEVFINFLDVSVVFLRGYSFFLHVSHLSCPSIPYRPSRRNSKLDGNLSNFPDIQEFPYFHVSHVCGCYNLFIHFVILRFTCAAEPHTGNLLVYSVLKLAPFFWNQLACFHSSVTSWSDSLCLILYWLSKLSGCHKSGFFSRSVVRFKLLLVWYVD